MKQNILNIKKIMLSFLVIVIAIIMVGCSNANSKAYETLNQELDNLSSVVSSTNSSEISGVSPIMIYSNSKTQIDDFKTLSSINMSREEEMRQRVLSLNSFIKSCNYEKLKLSKSKLASVETLTKDIKKYNQQLKNTKAELKTSVDNIKKYTTKTNTNNEAIETSYLALNNCMNQRYVCLCNLYNNLEQVYILLCKDCENCNIKDSTISNNNNIIKNDSTTQQTTKQNFDNEKTNDNKNEKTFKKNIDSYQRYEILEESKNSNDTSNEKCDHNNNTYPNNNVNSYNYPPRYNNTINNGYNPYYMPYGYGYNNGMYGNGMFGNNMFGNGYFNNGMFGYPNGYLMNPNRNTDTFYAFNKNIDTYRFNPNTYNNGYINNMAINEIPATAQAELTEEKEILLNEDKIDEIKENTKKLKPNNVINFENENNID